MFFNLFVAWPRAAGRAGGAIANFGRQLRRRAGPRLVVVLIDATNPRLRIDQSIRVFGVLLGVAAVGAGLAALGGSG